MSLFRRSRWFAVAWGITLGSALLSLTMPRGPALTALFDLGYFLLTLGTGLAMLVTALSAQGANRRFWTLMAAGLFLLASNQGAWVYDEVFRRVAVPDPWVPDIFLFLHLVPMIAAAGLRPQLAEGDQKFRLGTLDFFLLLVWWMFLYAFVVFPAQYVSLNVKVYDQNFTLLYVLESGVLVFVLGVAARGSLTRWKAIYLNLMMSSTLYAVASQATNVAATRGKYYTGSLYDIPLFGAASWMAATALSAREQKPEATPAQWNDRWSAVAPRLAMLAILSLPVLGLWTFGWDTSSSAEKTFRLFTVLVAMLVLGAFVFVRQYLQDRALIQLLEHFRLTFENEQRLQSHLVQREKLASLGQLVAGAAHEIKHPLAAILGYSEKLWSNQRLSSEQDALVRKIVSQSQRTGDLVANLLSFAQQSSGEKAMIDLSVLLQRSVQMRGLQKHDQKIRIETHVNPDLPLVWGDGHQLFQAFVQIVENALDALEEVGGGLLSVSAEPQGKEVIVHFSDSGPGIKEPDRVFDPFYTTKPIGKGTGLGLSAVYGVVQDHQGQITCENQPEGGAVFVLRLPIAYQADPQALAAAAKS
jgi:signal transduction histidine kinase